MSDGVVIALIGLIGTVLGAVITASATIVTKVPRGNQNSGCSLILITAFGATAGLVLGALFGVFLVRAITPQPQPTAQVIQVEPKTGIVVITPTPQPGVQIPKAQVPPVSASSIEFVKREETGGYATKVYNSTLDNGEIIIGQSYGFNQNTGGCCAFLVKGPGQFTLRVTDGAWMQYKNVTSAEQAESLLQGQIDVLVSQYQCTATTVKVSRLP